MKITPDYNPTGASKGNSVLLMDAQSIDETVSKVVCPGQGIENHTFTIRTSAAVTGAVILETATDPAYTGVWNPLAAAIDVATIGPAAAGVLEVVFANRMIVAARARISTVIAGGTVSVEYTGQ